MRSLVLATLAAGAALASDPAPLTYRFDEVKSKVLRSPGGDEKSEIRVAVGDTAAPGDQVQTGFWARAVVTVSERKARFELSSSSRVRLAGGEPGLLLSVEKGRLKAFFEKLTDATSEERRVAAPGAILAVRGTRYGLEVDGSGQAMLAVFEGTVEVIPTLPGVARVQVHAEEFCTFGPKASPHTGAMKSMGMSEGTWGMHNMGTGMTPGPDGKMPGMAPGGQMSPKSGGSMHGGSSMGSGGH